MRSHSKHGSLPTHTPPTERSIKEENNIFFPQKKSTLDELMKKQNPQASGFAKIFQIFPEK